MCHIAQLNIARMKFSMDDPMMKDFIDALDPVNAIADQSPGFVWRHQAGEEEKATIQIYDNVRIIVNLSVWETVKHLKSFLSTTLHSSIMRRRSVWFEKMDLPYTVLWWVPVGHQPTKEEAFSRLDYLRGKGPTDFAFGFSQTFPYRNTLAMADLQSRKAGDAPNSHCP